MMKYRTNKYSLIAYVAAICLILSSAASADWWGKHNGKTIKGSGKLESVDRELSGYDEIVIDNSVDMEIKIGDKFTARLEGDDNLLEFITTEVRQNTLYVSTKEDVSINSKNNFRLYITLPTLAGLEIQGSSDVRVQDLKSEDIFIRIAGSGDVDLGGTADEIEVEIDGSGNVDGRGFDAKFARIDINGSGDVAMGVSDNLRVTINGSGDVTYFGDPKVRQSVNGSGDLIARRK